jgi:hypothetical protein
MQMKLTRITPALARQYLQHNHGNRPLRPTGVADYLAAFKRGEYVQTHQGIAFDDTGRLYDGQHRLTAIAQMPEGFACHMLVFTDMPPQAADATDRGYVRSLSDVLRIPTRLASLGRFLAEMNEPSAGRVTPAMLLPYVDGIRGTYVDLVTFSPRAVRLWSSSAVLGAASLHLINGGDADYIKTTYRALNHAEQSMPPIAHALLRQAVGKDQLRVNKGYDLFVRAYRVFDQRHQHDRALVIRDPMPTVEAARRIIATRVLAGATGTATRAKRMRVVG